MCAVLIVPRQPNRSAQSYKKKAFQHPGAQAPTQLSLKSREEDWKRCIAEQLQQEQEEEEKKRVGRLLQKPVETMRSWSRSRSPKPQ